MQAAAQEASAAGMGEDEAEAAGQQQGDQAQASTPSCTLSIIPAVFPICTPSSNAGEDDKSMSRVVPAFIHGAYATTAILSRVSMRRTLQRRALRRPRRA